MCLCLCDLAFDFGLFHIRGFRFWSSCLDCYLFFWIIKYFCSVFESFATHVSSFWFLFDFISVPFFVSSLSLSHRVSLVVSLFSMFFVIPLCLICQSCVLVCVSVFVTCCFILIVSHSVWIVFSFTSSVSLVCYYFQVCSHLLHFLFLSCMCI